MDKTEKFFYLPQATNASFVPSPSDGPSCTPEPLEPEHAPSDENRGMTLRQGRENYRKWGAVREDLVRHARPPRPGEQPL